MQPMLKLYAEPECWEFIRKHPEEFASFGCGPGGIGDYFVPDTVGPLFWRLSIKPACGIHDWYYRLYKDRSNAGRKLADEVFGNNMIRIVQYYTESPRVRKYRLNQTGVYYKAVRALGGPSWWEDENSNDVYKEFLIG